jgi:hypothetical protein
MLKIVLLSVDKFSLSTAENIRVKHSIVNLDTLITALNEEEKRDVVKKPNSDTIIQVYDMENFADACNEQMINLDDWFVTYVKYKD